MPQMPEIAEETPRRIRSPKVELHKEFLDELHALWHQVKSGEHPKVTGPTTLDEFGQILAKEVGRQRPFAAPMVSTFLSGEKTHLDLLTALCQFFGVPSPLLTARCKAEIDWFSAGQTLLRHNSQEFYRLLRIAQELEKSEKEILKIEQELESNPDN